MSDASLHDRMDRLVGTWRTEGVVEDGGEHDGQSWRGFDVYEWFPGRRHLVHRVDVRIFGERRETLEVLTPRDATSIDQVAYEADGDVGRSEGWFDDEGRYRNDLPGARAVLTFTGADTMAAVWERRDADAWVPWMRVRFTRVGSPHVEVRSKDDHLGW
ncbi:hypothetical protein RDV89_01555 [Nocardioides zeae]|uniref:DUF1579 domain-containing protein n=1 Tax=Nocardioides imazamoxiresistens TaxID=3231893 RepID=A0ABU3PSH3_9ACTN|nr:hypothetical protein [Nocardioides zeae]MDT9591735.1 hypothetical protein [Nocardioides zeae]